MFVLWLIDMALRISFRFVCCTPSSASRCSCINKLLKIFDENCDGAKHCSLNRFVLCGIPMFDRLQARMQALTSPWEKHLQRCYARATTNGNETSNRTIKFCGFVKFVCRFGFDGVAEWRHLRQRCGISRIKISVYLTCEPFRSHLHGRKWPNTREKCEKDGKKVERNVLSPIISVCVPLHVSPLAHRRGSLAYSHSHAMLNENDISLILFRATVAFT